MRRSLRRLLATLGAVVLVGVGIGGTAAASPPRAGLPAAAVVPVTLNTSVPLDLGPNPRPAGLATFDISSGDGQRHELSGFTARNGADLNRISADFTGSFNPDPAVALPALRALYRDTDFIGGVFANPDGRHTRWTRDWQPGTYYLYDSAGPVVRALTLVVTATWQPARPPRVDAAASVLELGSRAVFLTPPRLPANGNLLLVNPPWTSQPYEFVFTPVNDGVTDADVQAYLDAVQAGSAAADNPFTGPGSGLLPISPGNQAVVRLDVPPGRYALLSFSRDPVTGVKRAFEGLHTIVTLR